MKGGDPTELALRAVLSGALVAGLRVRFTEGGHRTGTQSQRRRGRSGRTGVDDPRKHSRVDVEFPVQCAIPPGARFNARAKNLSLGGAFVAYDGPLPAFGSEVILRFEAPGGVMLRLAGLVRWNSPAGFGVQFGLVGAVGTRALIELIRQSQVGAEEPISRFESALRRPTLPPVGDSESAPSPVRQRRPVQ